MIRPAFTLRAALAAACCWTAVLPWAAALAQPPVPPPAARAPEPPVRIRTFERPLAIALEATANPDRAMLGVTLASGRAADTAGVEIIEVTPDGPAAKAGLRAGARLEAINGISLRLSADDAADPATADLGYRRLQRELAKQSAGDVVTLRVRDGSASREVRVTTVAARELTPARTVVSMPGLRESREALATRAALGLTLASTGSARDTLGVFVTRVTTDGPAERAGLQEGDRIASVNGVDVRVPREDVGDARAAEARVSRLRREIEKHAPGDRVALRVYGNGRYRDVTVTAGSAAELGGATLQLTVPPMPATVRGWIESPASMRRRPLISVDDRDMVGTSRLLVWSEGTM
jgi:predicted metalloprotease with PDZ domain